MDTIVMAPCKTPGNAWPLQALEFIYIIFILGIKKQTEALFYCKRQHLTNPAIFILPLRSCGVQKWINSECISCVQACGIIMETESI